MLQATTGGVRHPALCCTVWSLPRLRSSSGSSEGPAVTVNMKEASDRRRQWGGRKRWEDSQLVKQSHDAEAAPFLINNDNDKFL